jgi:hypothetical protein
LIDIIYRVKLDGYITIFKEDVISVSASSPEEAAEMAHEAFVAAANEQYGWADCDEIFIWECVECQ